MHDLKGKRVEVKPATPKGSTGPGSAASSGGVPSAPAGAAGSGTGTPRVPRGPVLYPSHQAPPFPFVTAGLPAGTAYAPAYGVYGFAPAPGPQFMPAQAAGAAYGVQYHHPSAGSHPHPYVMVPFGASSSGPYGAGAPGPYSTRTGSGRRLGSSMDAATSELQRLNLG